MYFARSHRDRQIAPPCVLEPPIKVTTDTKVGRYLVPPVFDLCPYTLGPPSVRGEKVDDRKDGNPCRPAHLGPDKRVTVGTPTFPREEKSAP